MNACSLCGRIKKFDREWISEIHIINSESRRKVLKKLSVCPDCRIKSINKLYERED